MYEDFFYGTLKKADKDYLEENSISEYYTYPFDIGHCVTAIPTDLFDMAKNSGELNKFTVPFPIAYIKEKGFIRYNGYLVCEGNYDWRFGLDIPEEYYEDDRVLENRYLFFLWKNPA